MLVEGADPTQVIKCPKFEEVCQKSSEQTKKCHTGCTANTLGMCMEDGSCFCFFGSSEGVISSCLELQEQSNHSKLIKSVIFPILASLMTLLTA